MQVAATAKPVDGSGVVFLTTTVGDKIKIDGDAAAATLTTRDGAVYEVADEAYVAERKLLSDAQAPTRVVRPVSKKALAARRTADEERRLGFFSALMTSGSFMMMQAGAF